MRHPRRDFEGDGQTRTRFKTEKKSDKVLNQTSNQNLIKSNPSNFILSDSLNLDHSSNIITRSSGINRRFSAAQIEIFNHDIMNKERIRTIVEIAVLFMIKIIKYVARRSPERLINQIEITSVTKM